MVFLPTGQIVTTPGALILLEESGVSYCSLLARHINGDWGEVCEEDWKENDLSADMGFRILSVYSVGKEKIWIITEADRSVTTFLLPEEY